VGAARIASTPVRGHVAFCAAFAVVLFVGYGHTLGYPYQYDDFSSIRDNPVLRAPGDLAAIWGFRPSRTVTHLSLAWNLQLAESTTGLRVVNIFIHAATSLLVGWIAAALWTRSAQRPPPPDPAPGSSRIPPLARGRGRARAGTSPGGDLSAFGVGACSALLFAAHPLATQAVTYIIQRGTSLAALLVLVAVAAFVRARERAGYRWWAVSWAAALMAGFTKEIAVVLPGLILAIERFLRGTGSRGGARSWQIAAYFLLPPVIALAASLPAAELGRAPSGLRETDEVSRMTYLLTQFTVIPRYLRLVVWPSGQSLDPDARWIQGPEAAAMLGLAGIVALCVLAIVLRHRLPLAALGVVWCLIGLLPESSIIPIRDPMVEHRMYLPLVGLVWAGVAMGAFGHRLLARRVRGSGRWAPGLALALVLVLAGVTHARNRVWRDELALWSDAVARAPNKGRPHNNRAFALEKLGRFAEAESAFRKAIALEPGYVIARMNLSSLYGRSGRPTEALAILEDAVLLEPRNPGVLNNLGSALWALGDTVRAAEAYRQVLLIEPGAVDASTNLERLRRATAGSAP
jgi:hypothetical protein